MSNQFEQIKRDIMSAMRSNKPRTSAYDTTAEVLYVEGETAWVRIPGGAPETPVDLSVAAKQGDIVQVRVANGRAWINGNSTAPPTDNTVANAAHTVATEAHEAVEELEEHFWYDGNGAHVEGESYRNDMRSDGLHIVEKNTGETVAKFGASGAQIGKDNENHAVIDSRSMSLESGYGKYFQVSDNRGEDGYATYTETDTGDGTTTTFFLDHALISITEVTVDGTVLNASEYRPSPQLDRAVIINTAPPAGAVITITYKSGDILLWLSFGSRKSNSTIGLASVAEGLMVEASGAESHAEGYNTVASGADSHAEGLNTTASGSYSHAEGQYTEATGGSSHAQNTHTIAAGSAQTAIGRYNKSDASGVYGLIMGNGTSQARSNAIGITWDGDYEFQADGDLLTALTSKGWNVAGTGGLVSLKKILANIINAL